MRDERTYLFDMIDSARMVQDFVRGRTYEQFQTDLMLREAVLRRLGIIGEAARCVSEATRQRMPNLPWRDIIGMRNVLVHVYFGVKLEIVWRTSTEDLPVLIATVEQFLNPPAPPLP